MSDINVNRVVPLKDRGESTPYLMKTIYMGVFVVAFDSHHMRYECHMSLELHEER
jgi:hypothetical protein